MAWVAEENFDSYSDGDLPANNGGTGWSNSWQDVFQGTDTDVQGTTTYQGAKAAQYVGSTASAVQRSLTTAVSSGVMYIALRAAQTNGGGFSVSLRNSSDSGIINIQFDAVDGRGTTGNIYLLGRSGGTPTVATIVSGYSANTWYAIRLTFDTGADTFSAAGSSGAYGSGGSYGTESTTLNTLSSGDAARIQLSAESTTADYFVDYISGTDPLTASAGGATFFPTLLTLGVG